MSSSDDFFRGFGHMPWFGDKVISLLFWKGITLTFELGVDCAAFVDRAVKNTREAGMVPSPARAAMMWVEQQGRDVEKEEKMFAAKLRRLAARIAHKLKFS